MNFKTIALTKDEQQKVSTDIQFIKSLAIACAPLKCRLIISGGYAVDGSLGVITRPHRDLDVQIFGQSSDAVGVISKLFQRLQENYPGIQLVDEGQEDYYHLFKLTDGQFLKVEIYYIQTLESPFDPAKITIRKGGTQSPVGSFDTVISTLEEVIFESISPAEILKDKLSKMEFTQSNDLPKHSQDIENLKLIQS